MPGFSCHRFVLIFRSFVLALESYWGWVWTWWPGHCGLWFRCGLVCRHCVILGKQIMIILERQ